MRNNLSRRDFLKNAGMVAGGIGAAALLSACKPVTSTITNTATKTETKTDYITVTPTVTIHAYGQLTSTRCQGAGKTIKDPCATCHGRGAVQDNKTLSVKVPPGVDTGDRIRLTGEGEAGTHGGPPGDLYVQISVK